MRYVPARALAMSSISADMGHYQRQCLAMVQWGAGDRRITAHQPASGKRLLRVSTRLASNAGSIQWSSYC